eukprot:scaffold227508_cov18-Prasinocladus_malaysianus.AAC.1
MSLELTLARMSQPQFARKERGDSFCEQIHMGGDRHYFCWDLRDATQLMSWGSHIVTDASNHRGRE